MDTLMRTDFCIFLLHRISNFISFILGYLKLQYKFPWSMSGHWEKNTKYEYNQKQALKYKLMLLFSLAAST